MCKNFDKWWWSTWSRQGIETIEQKKFEDGNQKLRMKITYLAFEHFSYDAKTCLSQKIVIRCKKTMKPSKGKAFKEMLKKHMERYKQI